LGERRWLSNFKHVGGKRGKKKKEKEKNANVRDGRIVTASLFLAKGEREKKK